MRVIKAINVGLIVPLLAKFSMQLETIVWRIAQLKVNLQMRKEVLAYIIVQMEEKLPMQQVIMISHASLYIST